MNLFFLFKLGDLGKNVQSDVVHVDAVGEAAEEGSGDHDPHATASYAMQGGVADDGEVSGIWTKPGEEDDELDEVASHACKRPRAG
jgi:hypothetical protein